jgi:hypothetical protein
VLRMLRPKLVAAAVAVLALGTGGGLAVAGAVGAFPRLGAHPVPAEKAAALGRLASVATTDSSLEPAPAPAFEPHPIPARMLGSDVPVPIAPSVLQARNGWLVSDGKTLVAVYAGASGADAAVGRVVIVRQDLAAGKQTVQSVDAGPTGPLTIASAPLGSAAAASAGTVTIRLRTPSGRVLSLDLGSGRFGGS